MSAKERKPFQPRPVGTIEISDQHKTGRLVLVAVLLAIAGAAFFFAIKNRRTAGAGWQTVTATTKEANCADEFTLLYKLGEEDPTNEFRAVTALYTDAVVKAYQLFHPDLEFDGVGNLARINHHPGETVEIDPVLYKILAEIEKAGDRRMYLGPLYWQYRIIYECESDAEAQDADPNRDPELNAFSKELAALAADPDQIELKLFGYNRVRLEVGADYASLLKRSGIPTALDFGRLKNALITDYLAERLAGQNLNGALITSRDGYARSLCSGESFDSPVYSLQGSELYPAASLRYTAPMSLVCFRNYPTAQGVGGYIYADGSMVTDWIDKDGMNKTCLPELLCLSEDESCTELVLDNQDLFTAERFDETKLSGSAVWCEKTTVCTRGSGFTITELFSGDEITFTLK